jgi:hypothetical protein
MRGRRERRRQKGFVRTLGKGRLITLGRAFETGGQLAFRGIGLAKVRTDGPPQAGGGCDAGLDFRRFNDDFRLAWFLPDVVLFLKNETQQSRRVLARNGDIEMEKTYQVAPARDLGAANIRMGTRGGQGLQGD